MPGLEDPPKRGKATHSDLLNSMDYRVRGVTESAVTERLSLSHGLLWALPRLCTRHTAFSTERPKVREKSAYLLLWNSAMAPHSSNHQGQAFKVAYKALHILSSWLYPSAQQTPNAPPLSIFSYFNFLPDTLPSLLFLNNASDTLHWLLALLGKIISQISLG